MDLREQDGAEQQGGGCGTGLLCAQLSLTRSTDLGPGMTKRLGVGFPFSLGGRRLCVSVFVLLFVLPSLLKATRLTLFYAAIANLGPESTRGNIESDNVFLQPAGIHSMYRSEDVCVCVGELAEKSIVASGSL